MVIRGNTTIFIVNGTEFHRTSLNGFRDMVVGELEFNNLQIFTDEDLARQEVKRRVIANAITNLVSDLPYDKVTGLLKLVETVVSECNAGK